MANNNVIKKIKIKQADGTFSDYYPIGANANNVTMTDGESVETKINKQLNCYDTVADMKADDYLAEGDSCEVLGFESPDDLGGGVFYITSTPLTDVSYTTELSNGLIANLIEDKSRVRYFFSKRWLNATPNNGEVCLIQAFGKNIVIDSHYANYKTEVYAFLARHGVTHIDIYVNSHYHNDHAGNSANLVNDGFIDSKTKIYLPAYTTLIGNSGQMYTYYTEMQQAMQAKGLSSLPMVEGQVAFTLGYNFTGTFYNCTTEILDTEMHYTNYNDCSLVLHMSHNGITSLYAGDNQRLDRLIINNLLTSKLDFLKISHHGLVGDNKCKNVIYENIARPYYAMQPNGPSAPYQGSTATNVEVKFLSDIGTKVYATDEQEDDVIFESQGKTFTCLQGKQLFRTSSKYSDVDFYVNSDYTANDSNGSTTKPFRSLVQAIAACDTNSDSEFHIYIQKYDTYPSQTSTYRLGTPKNKIHIHGLTDNTAITIADRFNFQRGNGNGKYVFENVTFDYIQDVTGSLITMGGRSYIEFINCRFVNTSGTTKSMALIWMGEHAKAMCDNCYFGENNTIGISTHGYSIAEVYNCTFNVENTPIQVNEDTKMLLIEANNTFLRKYNNVVLNTSYCRYNPGFGPRIIWKGNTTDTTQTYTTNFPITQAFMLVFETGAVSSNTFKVSFLKGYQNNKILAGNKFYIDTYHPLVKIKINIIDAYTFKIEYKDYRENVENPDYSSFPLRTISVINYGLNPITYDIDPTPSI